MTKRHSPPTRTSIESVVMRNPAGPHHSPMCSGSRNASNTSSRGASNRRVMRISRSAAMGLLLGFWCPLRGAQVGVETIETLVPVALERLDPVVHGLQSGGARAVHPVRAVAADDDKIYLAQHGEVL